VSPAHEVESRAARPVAPGEVQVWRGADRYWRYRYVHGPKGTVIQSNRSYLTRDEAVESARMAYPGVAVVELGTPPEGEPRRRAGWKRAAIKLFGVGLSALVVRTIVRLVLRVRRSARRARRVATWAGFAASLARRDPPSHHQTSR
jgi:hypothetical protein